jgi:hypothetical protein
MCRSCWGLTYASQTLQNYKNSLWGRRRARVDECWAMLTAERVYDRLLRDGAPITPGPYLDAWVADWARLGCHGGGARQCGVAVLSPLYTG